VANADDSSSAIECGGAGHDQRDNSFLTIAYTQRRGAKDAEDAKESNGK
jgi:hypothetical protein